MIWSMINLDKERSIDVIITRLRKIEIDPKILNFYKQLEELDMFYGLNKFIKNSP